MTIDDQEKPEVAGAESNVTLTSITSTTTSAKSAQTPLSGPSISVGLETASLLQRIDESKNSLVKSALLHSDSGDKQRLVADFDLDHFTSTLLEQNRDLRIKRLPKRETKAEQYPRKLVPNQQLQGKEEEQEQEEKEKQKLIQKQQQQQNRQQHNRNLSNENNSDQYNINNNEDEEDHDDNEDNEDNEDVNAAANATDDIILNGSDITSDKDKQHNNIENVDHDDNDTKTLHENNKANNSTKYNRNDDENCWKIYTYLLSERLNRTISADIYCHKSGKSLNNTFEIPISRYFHEKIIELHLT